MHPDSRRMKKSGLYSCTCQSGMPSHVGPLAFQAWGNTPGTSDCAAGIDVRTAQRPAAARIPRQVERLISKSSRDDVVDHFAGRVSQTEVAPAVVIRQLRMINAQQI